MCDGANKLLEIAMTVLKITLSKASGGTIIMVCVMIQYF
jgi:hypothetical protein